MPNNTLPTSKLQRRSPVPRGLSASAPVLFSYGFRPFFLGAGIWAFGAMILWMASLSGAVTFAQAYGITHWHAHEMLFGYSSAVLAGFLLTAVPNWTGRLPVSGWPLAFLFAVWVIGRLGLVLSDQIGVRFAIAADLAFLPLLLIICVREVVAGRKWKDLKVMAGLLALSVANTLYHFQTASGVHPELPIRLALSAYILMILIVGGRIIPSFTRNWLNKNGAVKFPVPYNHFDAATIAIGVLALAMWTAYGEGLMVVTTCALAAVAHLLRLVRWRGWATTSDALVFVLHISYLFVPIGYVAMALAAQGWMETTASLHVLTIGTVALMMVSVMTRASRGHTGRVLTASGATKASYVSLGLCALVRPATAVLPDHIQTIYGLSGALWLVAFALFLFEYGPMLSTVRRRTV